MRSFDRRALISGSASLAGGWLLPGSVGATGTAKCAPPRVIVVGADGNEVVGAEFAVSPREKRWKRDSFAVRCGEPGWEDAVAHGTALLNADLARKAVNFRAGGGGSRREGEIAVVHHPNLLADGYVGMAWYWVRDADPENITEGKVWMGITPDHPLFGETLLHELGHAVGLNHEGRTDPNGNPIAVMHPFIFGQFADYAPDDIDGFAKLRYRGDGNAIPTPQAPEETEMTLDTTLAEFFATTTIGEALLLWALCYVAGSFLYGFGVGTWRGIKEIRKRESS